MGSSCGQIRYVKVWTDHGNNSFNHLHTTPRNCRILKMLDQYIEQSKSSEVFTSAGRKKRQWDKTFWTLDRKSMRQGMKVVLFLRHFTCRVSYQNVFSIRSHWRSKPLFGFKLHLSPIIRPFVCKKKKIIVKQFKLENNHGKKETATK